MKKTNTNTNNNNTNEQKTSLQNPAWFFDYESSFGNYSGPCKINKCNNNEKIFHGQNGTLYWSTKNTKNNNNKKKFSTCGVNNGGCDYKYVGDFKNGKKDGKGVLYEGQGYNLYTKQNEWMIRYQGEWKNDQKHGTGEWENNYKIYGTYTFNDNEKICLNAGDIYQGGFNHNEEFDGEECEYIYKKTGEIYIGEYRNNLQHGEGTHKYPDGNFFIGTFYRGNFKYGTQYFSDDKGNVKAIKYCGEFKCDGGSFVNNTQNGFGIQYEKDIKNTTLDGDDEKWNLVYCGEWKYDHMHGDESLLVVDFKSSEDPDVKLNEIYFGTFKNDQFVKGIVYFSVIQTQLDEFQIYIDKLEEVFLDEDLLDKFFDENDKFKGVVTNVDKNGNIYYDGTVTGSDGSQYEGTLKNFEFDGVDCTHRYANGSVYKGGFRNGECDGNGEWLEVMDDKSIVVMQGKWKQHKLNGEGILKKNGDVYKGGFLDSEFHGFGVYKHKDGAIFEGNYENGNLNGDNCKIIYERGNKFKIYDGKIEYHNVHNCNVKSGKGRLEYSDGKIYEGEFLLNEFHGEGTLKYPNLKRYRGYFVNGKAHGYGAMFDKDNNLIQSGRYKNGNFISKKRKIGSTPQEERKRKRKKRKLDNVKVES